jgi:pimeloyl-ACP methyl ester carboxylesterase
LIVGDQSKPILVLVHGFGGSGALFYQIFKYLINYFNLILIDIIGMGSSSRPTDFKRLSFTH